MFETIENLKEIYRRRNDIYVKYLSKGFKGVLLDEYGSVSMSKIGTEAIGILVLVVIFSLIPNISSVITTNLNTTLAAGWEKAPSGASLWSQTAPILQAAVIIVVVGLILKVIYNVRAGSD